MIEEERLVSTQAVHATEKRADRSLRPQCLNDYIGQADVCQQLAIFIQAAKARGDALDHVLVFGPPGLGKTTLGHIIAHEMGVSLHQTAGPALEKTGDLAAILTSLQPYDVLFIDEIHRLSVVIEEMLYPAMEDGKIDIILGEGPAARSIQLDLPPFTLVGATTRTGLLTSPLRDRFGIVQRLIFYTPAELARIIARSAQVLQIPMEPGAARTLARSARGTPRIANRLLRRIRDYTQVTAAQSAALPAVTCEGGMPPTAPCITADMVEAGLALLKIDQQGFDAVDRAFLLTLIEKFAGGPVGLETLAAILGEAKDTVEDVIEPFLIQGGYLCRTPRGRKVTDLAYRHFGLTPRRNTRD